METLEVLASLRFQKPSAAMAALSRELERERMAHGDKCHTVVFVADELSTIMRRVASTSLPRDVELRLNDDPFIFNAQLRLIAPSQGECVFVEYDAASEEATPWMVRSAFTLNHHWERFAVAIARPDAQEFVVALNAVRQNGNVPALFAKPDLFKDLSWHVYYHRLRQDKVGAVSGWQKAVHELSTPLGVIYTESDFLPAYLQSPSVSDEDKKRKLEDLQHVAQLLMRRLDVFKLAFSGISHQPTSKYLRLYDLAMPLTHLFYHASQKKGIKFHYDGLRNRNIYADSDYVSYILFNLVSNAIKYGAPGYDIRLRAFPVGVKLMQIDVENRGIGIDEADAERIFHLYERGATAQRTDSRGMGVGLPVSRDLAKAMGGRLFLKDGDPETTTFTLELPLGEPSV